jgi:hypothetical protein
MFRMFLGRGKSIHLFFTERVREVCFFALLGVPNFILKCPFLGAKEMFNSASLRSNFSVSVH